MTTGRKRTTGRTVTHRTVAAAPATSSKGMTSAGRPAALRVPSFAEVSARLNDTDRVIRRVSHSAASAMRGSMSDAATAAKTVRVSMKQAMTAVRRASRGIARRFTVAARSMTVATPPANRTAGAGRRASTSARPKH
jgi:hypothetical protein